MILYAASVILLILIYILYNVKYSFWSKRGVVQSRPTMFFGDLFNALLMKTHVGDVYTQIYNKYKGQKYVGCYNFTKPALLLRDPALISDILTRDFHHFSKNEMQIDQSVDKIRGRCPFALHGDAWKKERKHLTYNYSLNTVRNKYPLVYEVGNKLVKFINERIRTGEADNIDSYDLATRYTTEIVIAYGMSVEAEAFDNENAPFLQIARSGRSSTFIGGLASLLIQCASDLTNALKIRKYDDQTTNFYDEYVQNVVKYRKQNDINTNDFLNHLCDIQKSDPSYTNTDVMAQIAGFFDDAVGNTSLAMTFMLQELSNYPEVQEKLHAEIHSVLNEKESISYEDLNKMKYLDCVVNETIRLHNPDLLLMKRCVKEYQLPDSKVVLEPETTIIIPINAIHHDEDFYKEPYKFDPERWSDERKDEIDPQTFLPFGSGPRKCIGMPLALIQFKVLLVSLFANFKLESNCKRLATDPKVLYRAPSNAVPLRITKVH